MRMFAKLWNDDRGALLSAEWVFMATIMVIGLVVGWYSVRNAVVSELIEVSNAITALDQSYKYPCIKSCSGNASTGGVCAKDHPERTCATDVDAPCYNLDANLVN